MKEGMAADRKAKRVALFVGVDEYEDKSIPTLSGAVADAKALYEFFSLRPNQFDIAEFLPNPKTCNVYDKVEELYSGLSEGDLFLFYFAGHGMDDGGKQKLLCTDTRRGRRSLVNEFDLRHVAGIEKWDVAVILDACRTRLDATRGMEARVGDRRDLDFYDALVKSRKEGDSSLTVLFSCDEGKTAGELTGRKHGLFTYALLDVLERADRERRGWRFDQNLGDEIGAVMRHEADENSGQRPWIKASGTPPLFFLPSMDIAPLREYVLALLNANAISDEIAGECLKALDLKSDKPGAKGIFEAIRFFSNWGEERLRQQANKEVIANILCSMCKGGTRIESSDNAKPVMKSKNTSPSDISESHAPLTARDKRLLSYIESRLKQVDGRLPKVNGLEVNNLNYIHRMPSADDAADALNRLARERMRTLCTGCAEYALFEPEEHAEVEQLANDGASGFAAAVCELLRDDEALSRT